MPTMGPMFFTEQIKTNWVFGPPNLCLHLLDSCLSCRCICLPWHHHCWSFTARFYSMSAPVHLALEQCKRKTWSDLEGGRTHIVTYPLGIHQLGWVKITWNPDKPSVLDGYPLIAQTGHFMRIVKWSDEEGNSKANWTVGMDELAMLLLSCWWCSCPF